MRVNDWVELLAEVCKGKKVTCPVCGGDIESHLFARNVDNEKWGFATLECKKCKLSHQFSRVKFSKETITEEY